MQSKIQLKCKIEEQQEQGPLLDYGCRNSLMCVCVFFFFKSTTVTGFKSSNFWVSQFKLNVPRHEQPLAHFGSGVSPVTIYYKATGQGATQLGITTKNLTQRLQ